MAEAITPSWRFPGFVSDKRPLEKDGKAWAYSLKTVAMGITCECTTRDKAAYELVRVGAPCVIMGSFEQYNGTLRLSLGSIEYQK